LQTISLMISGALDSASSTDAIIVKLYCIYD
jgi:hypothetical protein